jgi:hypothetical protein
MPTALPVPRLSCSNKHQTLNSNDTFLPFAFLAFTTADLKAVPNSFASDDDTSV